ncbi:MAG: nitroreductase family protein [Arcobacteraceae bacterium]
MTFDDLKNLVQNSRCYRIFDANFQIPHQDLVDLVELARISSSARNTQPLRYKIIDKNPQKLEIFTPLRWASNLSWNGPSIHEMPSAFIVVCKDTNLGEFALVDAGIAMQNIMLGLKSKGLDGCMLASIDKQKYKEVLQLPQDIEPMFAIAIGKADQKIEMIESSDTKYYRNEDKTHIVPKLPLNEVLL